MKRLVNFIVEKRYLILGIMLVLTMICAVQIPKIEINADMTKYLADDSSMKYGMDIMETEFEESVSSQAIHVMMHGLTKKQAEEMHEELLKLSYVHDVVYEVDSEDYNKDGYTLFEVTTKYDYGTEEVDSIEQTIAEKYEKYDVVVENDEQSFNLTFTLIAGAVAFLMIILFVMCGSWFEPIIFIVVIGFGVAINMGTNIILGSISSITSSIAAILQLVLSMDYSIILMNRYRQEIQHVQDKKQAMKNAMVKAFSSITSSAFTTFVGLLMLIFMKFKIGADLGIVLAKGVLCSLLCIFTILPCLILMFDKLIQKTVKPEPYIPTKGIAAVSYRFRYPMAILFVILFIGSFFLQTLTPISFSMVAKSEIAKIFPKTNAIVVLYNNKDSQKIQALTDVLERDSNVKTAVSYPTTLGRQYEARKLQDMITDMDMDIDVEIDSSLLKVLYYNYHSNGVAPSVKVGDLLTFISDEVVTNDVFSKHINAEIADNIGLVRKLEDAKRLTTPMNPKEITAFLEQDALDEDMVEQLYMLYFSKYGGVDTGIMTIPTFVNFLLYDILDDPDYVDLIDDSIRSQIKSMEMFTNANNLTTQKTYSEMAFMMNGIDENQMKLLYVYYYAMQDSYTPGKMTLPEFVDFLQNDVLQNPMFSSQIDDNTVAMLGNMAQFTDKENIEKQRTSIEMAESLGMNADLIEMLYSYCYGQDMGMNSTLTLPEFVAFLTNNVLPNEVFSNKFTEEQIQQLNSLNLLIQADMNGEDLSAQFTEEQLAVMEPFVLAVQNNQAFTVIQMAEMLGVEEELVTQLYILYFGGSMIDKTMSMNEFVNYLLTDIVSNPMFAPYFNDESIAQLEKMQILFGITLSEQQFSYTELNEVLESSIDEASMRLLYVFHDSYGDTSAWRLSLQIVINFIMENKEQFSGMLNSSDIESLELVQKLVNGTVAGTYYSAESLASMIGMNANDIKQIYLLYITKYGDTSSWRLSLQTFVDFVLEEVVTDPSFVNAIDGTMVKELEGMNKIMDAVISGELYSPAELESIFDGFTESLDKNMIELLCIFYGSEKLYDASWTMSIEELFDHLSDDIISDARFEKFLEDDFRKTIVDTKEIIDNSIAMLRGENYSILMLSTTLLDESEETMEFLDTVDQICEETFEWDYYLIGNSAMYREMQNGFDKEMLFITILTAVSIFLIVAVTFRSIIIPIILVMIVMCGVYVTVAVTGLRGESIMYLAYIIVQCILMGATIDYGILFTNYYREMRYDKDIREALTGAYENSIHTIFTSGLIIVLITATIGFFSDNATIAPICLTLSMGTFSAIILILFVMPGMLATLDKFIVKKK